MNDLRLSAFAPRRRFSYAVSFDGYITNAIRIYNDHFWRAAHYKYLETGPDKYEASPEWWCISGYEFIARHQGVDESEDSIDDSILDEIL